MNDNDSRLVEIYRAKDGIEAALIQGALEDAGIRARVEGDQLQGSLGGRLRLGWTTSPRIIVFENDAARASEIVRELPKR
jgi:Putative prokaryotic signal transducing protein